jgi:7-cyano-7-deazaguanine reductase
MTELPLGKTTTYPDRYAPEVLHGIERRDNRERIGIGDELPFSGVDLWNAWDLTWLGADGQPRMATAEIAIPARSPRIVESKSMKLYLGSFAMSTHASAEAVRALIATDLAECAGGAVAVRVDTLESIQDPSVQRLPGDSLDRLAVSCNDWQVNPALLAADTGTVVSEALCTDALRSLCPVTGQPDLGSVLVRYRGPRIDRAALLRYIVSYRCHQDFHESCIERMFVDLLECCRPEALTVYARYQRRGGIDINPFRSNFEDAPPNLRLWRQ